jgi:hypothetical protein
MERAGEHPPKTINPLRRLFEAQVRASDEPDSSLRVMSVSREIFLTYKPEVRQNGAEDSAGFKDSERFLQCDTTVA